MTFKGFERPTDNYSKLPHSFIDVLPDIETMAEMKVVLYLLRHTWGFSEFGKPKKLTTDEFAHGRKKKDSSRMDKGTGLSENSVRSGLEKAIEHGFITVEIDESDAARIEKWYCLNMETCSEIESRPAEIAPLNSKVAERSEKETIERKEKESPDLNSNEMQQVNSKVDYYLAMANFKGAKLEARIDAILSYLGESFHRNTETAEWKKFAKMIESNRLLKNWDVQVFVKWLKSQDGYKPEFWPVKKMIEFYPSAFAETEKQLDPSAQYRPRISA